MLVVVLVGKAAIDGGRDRTCRSMISGSDDLVRRVQILVVVHPILQSRDKATENPGMSATRFLRSFGTDDRSLMTGVYIVSSSVVRHPRSPT